MGWMILVGGVALVGVLLVLEDLVHVIAGAGRSLFSLIRALVYRGQAHLNLREEPPGRDVAGGLPGRLNG